MRELRDLTDITIQEELNPDQVSSFKKVCEYKKITIY